MPVIAAMTAFTGSLITMLRLVKDTTSPNAVIRASGIIKKCKKIFETSYTLLLDALCDVDAEGK